MQKKKYLAILLLCIMLLVGCDNVSPEYKKQAIEAFNIISYCYHNGRYLIHDPRYGIVKKFIDDHVNCKEGTEKQIWYAILYMCKSKLEYDYSTIINDWMGVIEAEKNYKDNEKCAKMLLGIQ